MLIMGERRRFHHLSDIDGGRLNNVGTDCAWGRNQYV